VHPVIDLSPPAAPERPGAVDPGPPAVLLLHGQPGLAVEWFRVVELLAPTCRLVVPDRPGYDGRPQRATDWAANAEAAVQLLDELGLARAVVVAFSWATGAALELALRFPDRVRGLVLVGSVGAPGAVTRSDRLVTLPGVLPLGAAMLTRTGPRLADLIAWSAGSRLDADTLRALRAVAGLWRERGAWRAAAMPPGSSAGWPGCRHQLSSLPAPATHTSRCGLPSSWLTRCRTAGWCGSRPGT